MKRFANVTRDPEALWPHRHVWTSLWHRSILFVIFLFPIVQYSGPGPLDTALVTCGEREAAVPAGRWNSKLHQLPSCTGDGDMHAEMQT